MHSKQGKPKLFVTSETLFYIQDKEIFKNIGLGCFRITS